MYCSKIYCSLLLIFPLLISCSSRDHPEPDAAASESGLFSLVSSDSITPIYNGDIEAGDFDGDGDNDLIVSGLSATGPSSEIYFNDSTGKFIKSVNDLANVENSAVAVGDLDQDSDLDIVLLGVNDSAAVAHVYFNNGSGIFESGSASTIEPLAFPSVAIGDFDGNSTGDLVIAGYADSEYLVQVFLNDGFGQFSLVSVDTQSHPGQYRHSAQPGDIDHDGDLDIVALYYSAQYRYQLRMYKNDGVGGFTKEATRNVANGVLSEGSSSFKLADFDNDNDADMVVVQNATSFRHWAGSSGVLVNDGGANFGELQHISLPTKSAFFCVSDVDQNQTLDLVAFGDFHYPASIYIGDYLPESRLVLNQRDADSTTISDGVIHGSAAGACTFADINGDGTEDLLVTGLSIDDSDPLPEESRRREAFHIYINNPG